MATIDVTVPYHNTRIEYTREMLSSVRAQTFQDWRLTLVNDGSTPESTSEIEQLLAEVNDPRILYLRQGNKGLAAARNAGLRTSDSPFVAFLDSDDTWTPGMMARLLPVFETQPSADVVYGSPNWIVGEAVIPYRPGSRTYLGALDDEGLFLRMLQNNVIGIHTAICRRAAVEDADGFDETFRSVEDKDFWLRLMLRGRRFVYIDEAIANYRQHESNMSKNGEHMRRGRIRLIEKLDRLIETRPAHWTHLNWPRERTRLLRHANLEAGETAFDNGDYLHGLLYSLPTRSGLSTRAATVGLLSFCNLIIRRRRRPVPTP